MGVAPDLSTTTVTSFICYAMYILFITSANEVGGGYVFGPIGLFVTCRNL